LKKKSLNLSKVFTHTERPFFNFDVNLDPDNPMEDFKYCQPSQLYHSSLQIRNQQQHQTQHLIQQLGLPSQLQGSGQYSNAFNTNNQSPNNKGNSNNLRCNSLDGWNPGGNTNIMSNRRSDENINECVIQNSNNSNNNVNINYSNQNNSLTNNTTSNTTNANTNSGNSSNSDNRNSNLI